jgi:hypothetical protein
MLKLDFGDQQVNIVGNRINTRWWVKEREVVYKY